jgi:hypothetical protein
MTNKHFMIFQTAVRKYLDMHEKSLSGYFLFLFTDYKKKEKILDEKCVKFF